MKTRLCVACATAGLAAGVFFTTPTAPAAVSFSAGIEIGATADFVDPLTPYGTWVTVGSHGRCWRPARVEAGWRPYGDGHWEWTDCGWYWVSDEPWAWACYHYGSWEYDNSYGWVWIPATEWSPAWVSWREGPDYIGWAPCGPRGAVLAPSLFCFVDIHHFREPHHPRDFVVNNQTIIQRTTIINNNIRRENRTFEGRSERVVVNNGPRVDVLQKATGARFTARPVREVVRQEPLPERIRQQKTTEAWRRDASPVLKDQPRNAKTAVEPAQERREREQRNVQPTPAPSQSRQPVIAPEKRTPLEPSGRDQQRVFPQPPQAVQPPAPKPPVVEKPVVPTPRAPERITPPQPLPPTTGREPAREERKEERREVQPAPKVIEPRAEPRSEPRVEQRREERPAVHEAPPRAVEHPAPAEHGRDKDKDKP